MKEELFHLLDQSLVEVCTIIGVSIVAHSAINIVMKRLYRRFDINTSDNLKQRRVITQLLFVQRILKGLLWLVALSAILMTFDDLKQYGESILASAGVLSVIIGFAAQKSLGNLIAGFQIAFTQPLRIDDAVVIEGEWGWVEEITLTYVVVRIWDKRRLVLPIS